MSLEELIRKRTKKLKIKAPSPTSGSLYEKYN
jgi:hypothetical protein